MPKKNTIIIARRPTGRHSDRPAGSDAMPNITNAPWRKASGLPSGQAEVGRDGADGGSEDQQRQMVNGVGEVEQQAGGRGASLGHGSRRGRCRFRIRRRRWGD